MKKVMFGMGWLWGEERILWKVKGVYVKDVGYEGGIKKNKKYEEKWKGMKGNEEVVMVVYEKKVVKINELMEILWEENDKKKGMRKGNDIGKKYR